MLAHLEDPSLKKTLNTLQLDQAKQFLLAKGGLGRLAMNLTGSGGSGKSFVLDASTQNTFLLWLCDEHYGPIFKVNKSLFCPFEFFNNKS
jgi:hypothetical protein